MPIKEYSCDDCGHVFENITTSQSEQRRLDTEGLACPECESKNTKASQVPKKTGFILKGKGWYKDGYK